MNTKNEIYSNEKFNFSNTQNLSLFIEVGFRHFNACVTENNNTSDILYIENLHFENINQLESQSKVLQYTFGKVIVSFTNETFTLIPEAIFEEGNLSDYLNLNLGDLKNEIERFSTIKNHGCINAYRINSDWIDFFEKQFKNVIFLHSSSVFLNLSSINKQAENELFLNIYNNHFYIAYFIENKLNLLNSFEFKTEPDLIYLMLFLTQELGINQKDAQLIISGNSSYNKSLNEYFPKIKHLDSKLINNPDVPTQILSKSMISLFSHKCA